MPFIRKSVNVPAKAVVPPIATLLIVPAVAGLTVNVPVPVGENLFPQTVILSLIDLNHLYLEVSLEQQGAMKLSIGMKSEISFEFFRNKKMIGEISTIYPKNDQFIGDCGRCNCGAGQACHSQIACAGVKCKFGRRYVCACN